MKYLPLDTIDTGHSGYQQHVKEGNIKRIFDLVRSGKCKSRAELVRIMNLSATSVSVLVEELAERHLIDEIGPTQTSLPGRRPISLRLNSATHQMAVFTLLCDGVRYELLDLECQVIESRFFPLDLSQSPAPKDGDAYVRLIEDILEHHAEQYDPSRTLMVGICLPGTYVQCDGVFLTQAALGVAISEESLVQLRQRIQLPLYLANSTKSLAYAEKKYLDATSSDDSEAQDLLYVEIRDGISCAIISHGDIYSGPYNVAGEIGHFTIDYQGRPCPCGNTGCLEQYVNLNAILADAQQACREASLGTPETFEALASRYMEEPVLLASVNRSAKLLAFGLYSLLCSSGMRRIVLGGGIEALGQPFLQEIYRALCSRTLLIRHLDLNYAKAGPDAESAGIAHHFLDKVYSITS